MFVRHVVDPPKDRQMRIDFIFRRDVHEAVIFDVEIRTAEIQLLARIHELCLDRRAM